MKGKNEDKHTTSVASHVNYLLNFLFYFTSSFGNQVSDFHQSGKHVVI